MIKKSVAVQYWFIFMLLFSTSGKVSIAFSMYCITFVLCLYGTSFKVNKRMIILLMPLIILFIIGLMGSGGNTTYALMKDAWYLLKVILTLSIGYLLMYYIKSFRNLCSIVVITGAISSGFHLLKIVLYGNSLSASELVHLREDLGVAGSLLSILALIIILFGKQFVKMPGYIYVMAATLCALSIMLSMSRTYIIIFIIMAFVIKGKQLLNASTMIITLVLSILVMGIITANINSQFVQKFANSMSEIGIQDYSEKSEINSNWRGYEAFRALVEFQSGSVTEKIFGQGFGAQIDLGFEMQLGGNMMRMIPMTHNAYMYLLVKFGIVGLLVYAYFIYKFIHGRRQLKIEQKINENVIVARLISGLGWLILLTTLVISGVFNIYQLDGPLMILGALCFVSLQQQTFLKSFETVN